MSHTSTEETPANACNQVDHPANIADWPQHQERNIRHHRCISDTLFPRLLKLLDMGFCCFSFFMQDFFITRIENLCLPKLLLLSHVLKAVRKATLPQRRRECRSQSAGYVFACYSRTYADRPRPSAPDRNAERNWSDTAVPSQRK